MLSVLYMQVFVHVCDVNTVFKVFLANEEFRSISTKFQIISYFILLNKIRNIFQALCLK